MTLYEMLDRAMAHQKVWIFEQNTYDQNMPLFKGTVNEARIDPELSVWDFLMCEVELYDCFFLAVFYKPIPFREYEGRSKWQTIFSANDRQSVIDAIPAIVENLQELYDRNKEEGER